ncbi:enoyl-CoA hydratase [Ornithobacterium rhinotracheale]|uniref:enoyl-CoA hydratase/isomerase family protein n=1 Tax=Ornithobacterium rhinotracheale TaxID=28251 RepID=UPI00129C3942|nr:enoyl-CoA hydratase-related protein [Ornithobacterium rhinotracheale]MRJ11565.1 enoyl-CoA hydratase [Ornithobacterium rhinotracheale]
MELKNLILEKNGRVATIYINRPESLNALDSATIEEFGHLIYELENDDSVRAIIITGAGDESFASGADIKEFKSFNKPQGENLSRRGQEILFNRLVRLSKPTIAAINGHALGGGLELALACHIRIASEKANIGFPELSLGLIPAYGGTQKLPILIGKSRALEFILLGKKIPMKLAREWGLVYKVVPHEELMTSAMELAQTLCNNSATATAAAIKAVNAAFTPYGQEAGIKLFGSLFGTEDFEEGTSAFIEKRKPNFK